MSTILDGDATCGQPSAALAGGSEVLDGVIFQLPDGYRPEHLEVFASANPSIGLNFIIPEGGLTVDGTFLEGGSVFVYIIEGDRPTTLDGFTFRAATTASAVREAGRPASVSLQSLRDLLD